jgi:PPE-repeat protein
VLLWATPGNSSKPEVVELSLSNPHFNPAADTVSFTANAPAIAAAESAYEQMWAQDVAAMAGFHSAGLFMGSGAPLGSAITLVNNSSSTTEFQLYQGNNQIARVGVKGHEKATVPTEPMYVLDAEPAASPDAVPNPVLIDASRPVTAQVIGGGGNDSIFVKDSGPAVDASGGFQASNYTNSNVNVSVTGVDEPFETTDTLAPDQSSHVSGDEGWSVDVTVNGVTSTVQVTDPNATVTAVNNNSNDAVTLKVS